MALERKGYWPLAVLRYQDALEIDPQLAAAHCNLGAIQAGSGSFDEAIDHYRQALRIDPDCARAHHLLGIALVAKGRFEEADDDYPESVKPLNQFRGPALDEAMSLLQSGPATVTPRGCRPVTRSAFPRRTRPD